MGENEKGLFKAQNFICEMYLFRKKMQLFPVIYWLHLLIYFPHL